MQKPVVVDAVRMKEDILVAGENGDDIEAKEGEWLVNTPEGEQIILSDEEFNETYQPYIGTSQKRLSVKEVFDLFAEDNQQNNEFPQPHQEQVNPARGQRPTQPDKWGELQPLFGVEPSETSKQPKPKKKKRGLFSFLGRKKRKAEEEDADDFRKGNIQCV